MATNACDCQSVRCATVPRVSGPRFPIRRLLCLGVALVSLGSALQSQDLAPSEIDSSWVGPIAAAIAAVPADSLCRTGRKHCSIVAIDPAVYQASLSNGHAYPLEYCRGRLPLAVLTRVGATRWKAVISEGFTTMHDCGDSGIARDLDRRHTLTLTVAIPSAEVRTASEAIVALWVWPPWIWPGWEADVWLRRDEAGWRATRIEFYEE
jgi:hypothetical protein